MRVQGVEILAHADAAGGELMGRAAGQELVGDVVVGNEMVVEVARLLQQGALAVQHRLVRAAHLVQAEDVEVAVQRLDVDREMRRERCPVDEGERADGVDLLRQRRHVVHDRGDVGAMGESDQPGARRQQLVQLLIAQGAGFAIHLPFADDQAELLQPAPGADIGLVVLLGHDDLVARLELMPQRLRHQVDVHGGGGSEHDLVVVGVDELRHQVLARRDAVGGADRRREVPVRLHLGLGHVVAGALDHLARHVGAAGILHEHPAVAERRELFADVGGVEGCHGAFYSIVMVVLGTTIHEFRWGRPNGRRQTRGSQGQALG